MKQRILTAVAIVAAVIPIAYFSDTLVYPIALALLCTAAEFEMLRALGRQKDLSVALPACIMALLFPLGAYIVPVYFSVRPHLYFASVGAILFGYMLYLFGIVVMRRGKTDFVGISEVFVTALYVILSFTSLSLIRRFDHGAFYFGMPFIIAWICDVFAFFTGSFFGKHPLSPEISPKKTIEGAVGGIVFGTAALLLYGWILQLSGAAQPRYLVLLLYGVLLSVVSQIGDLVASLIKREHKIKDYGRVLPGHGGIMDRFDSVLGVSTLLAVLCLFFPPFI